MADDVHVHLFLLMRWLMMSMGTGKMMVEFFSADMEFSVWNRRQS
jgi:hypothetical protein